jgi:hypothetical protein
MKFTLLALTVVGASAQVQPMQYFTPTTATGYNFATAAPFNWGTWPTATAAPAEATAAPVNWNMQGWNPYQQWNPYQPLAPVAAGPKTGRDFSDAVRECVKGQDAWCDGNNWDATCTEIAEGRKCQASKGVTVAEKEYIDRCVRTKGKQYQDPVGEGGDTWCSRRLNQWDNMCTQAEEGCTQYVRDIKDKGDDATDDEKKELTDAQQTCISRRDAWCDNWNTDENLRNWDSVCTEVESKCNSPPAEATAAPTQAPFFPQYWPQQYQAQYATAQGVQYPQYTFATAAPAARR